MGSTSASEEFPTTAWSLVLSAGNGSAGALEKLFARYRPVIVHSVRWFQRAHRMREGDAEDYAQEFLVHVLAHRESVLGGADPDRGRFRTWLRACLRNWMWSRAESEGAAKRGGGVVVGSLDGEAGSVKAKDDLEAEFDRRWAQDVLARALVRLRGDEAAGVLEPGDVAAFDLKHGSEALAARAIAERLGRTENEIVVSLRRTIRRLKVHLREEVAPTIATEGDFRKEIEDLFSAFGN